MPSFISAEQSIPTATATRIVDAADFDRAVTLNGSNQMRFAFTSADAPTGSTSARLALATSLDTVQFVLPADEELWVYHTAGFSTPASYLITSIAR